MFLWKNSFSAVERSLSNISSIGLRTRDFNMSYNLVYAASISVFDRDLMVSSKMADEL